MFENAVIEKYIEYTEILRKKLDGYFKDQKEFLACRAGCDICCNSSYYPSSALEYEYVRTGINTLLSEEKKQEIYDKVIKILKDRRNFLKTNPNVMEYSYSCPFLVDGACGIYQYRPLLCRTHGLIYNDIENENRQKAPHCMKIGLNYANVYDEKTGKFSLEKVKELGLKSTPKSYDLSYSIVMKESGIKDFGDVRMLFEWVIMDIPNYEELIKED